MSKPIRVIQYGLGAIGRAAATLALTKRNLQVVGAVDRDPALVGRDLCDVLGLEKKLGVKIGAEPAEVFSRKRADVVIHCTTSSFGEAYDQIAELVQEGLHCVTSCEEAMFPYYRHKQLAEKLDRLCVKNSVSVVGTGVNPGFVMDTLAVLLTAVCQRVDTVRVLRVVDAATRREALQRKVGVGLSEAEFQRLATERKLGHVGLAESLVFIADSLGWNLKEVDESIAPVLADKALKTEYFSVKPGEVVGVRQFARGLWKDREVLTLELQMYAGAPQPRDEIEISGQPPLRLAIEGGVAGDLATPAILVNMVPRLLECRPGLHTMRSLGLPRISG